MWGRDGNQNSGLGVKEGELRPAFKALQTAWIRLLQNPFFVPDEYGIAVGAPGAGDGAKVGGKGGMIKNKMFGREVERIGMGWKPGVTNI